MFKQMPPVTKNLIVINCIVYLAQLVAEQRGVDLVGLFGLHFAAASDFGLYQLVTYMFLHGSLTHLFFNMFSLWMFGRLIENTMGLRRFLVYYFVCGIGAGVCQEVWQAGEFYLRGMNDYAFVTDGYRTMIPMAEFLNSWTTIGASGACYGVLLAFGMTFPNERIMLLIPPIPMKAKYFVVGYAAIELFSAFTSNGNIAHFAHLGGMLFGFLLILYWRNKGRGRRFESWETWTPRRNRTVGEKMKDWWRKRSSRKPGMKLHKGGKNFKDRDADYEYNEQRKQKQQRVDEILDKIRRSGYENLTDEEKRTLFENSRH
ncbi:MAG: rhomboid family intramembrane serine protease [Bacteroidaceae bacterium]|nr:rhomboid family intramembrane serine protease [Bacteroidaceae bacterium]